VGPIARQRAGRRSLGALDLRLPRIELKILERAPASDDGFSPLSGPAFGRKSNDGEAGGQKCQ
jgi:hypothetical protein